MSPQEESGTQDPHSPLLIPDQRASRSFVTAGILSAEGIELEVIDPRTLVPLDTDTIFSSVEKTNRAIITDEEVRRGGSSAELASRIAEECFDYLDAPVRRVAAADVPMPFSPVLEKLAVPSVEKLLAAARDLVA